MKSYIIILALIFPLTLVGQDDFFIPETLADLNFKGKVKTVKEITYEAIKTDKGLVKNKVENVYKWERHKILSFNVNGQLEKREHLDDNLRVKQQDIFKFQNDLMIYRKTKFTTDSIFYDNQNRIIRINQLDRTPSAFESGKERPKKGIKRIYKFSYDGSTSMKIYEYQNNNELRCIEIRKYVNDKVVYQELKYGSYKDWYSYEYDTNGLLLKISWSDNEEGLLERTTFTYNSNKEMIHEKWELFIEGEYDGVVEYKYLKENETTITEKSADGELDSYETYTYKFDHKGNWIRQELTVDNEEYFITERQIEYY